ncbi:MAG: heavy metal-responsive transcriptional regulator [Arenicella sp.]|jgi:MerR family copper efflux transcriptional regulator|nr:heavy metal-responsive transcriptional regulator [Arenicella sp.]
MSSIGEVAKLLGVSTHTLRYYEKIGLLPLVDKSAGGRRNYGDREIERVRFIKRAKRMHFTLEEIRTLIELDKAPITEKPQVQRLVQDKLLEVEEGLADLKHLKKDLSKMLNACKASGVEEDCPIMEGNKQP